MDAGGGVKQESRTDTPGLLNGNNPQVAKAYGY